MVPDVGLSINEIKLSKVDFPDPEGPIIAYVLPNLNFLDRPLSTLIFFSVVKLFRILINSKKLFIFQ